MVDTLNNRLDSVERKSDRIQGENDVLRGENSELTDAIAAMQCPAVADTLVADDIGIVAVRGVDEDTVKNTVAAATCGGGTVTGTLWLEDKWALANDDDVAAMAQALGSSSKRKDDVARRGVEAAGRAPAGTAARGRHLHRSALTTLAGRGLRQVRARG